jgi:predicted alpha/beta hydrolase
VTFPWTNEGVAARMCCVVSEKPERTRVIFNSDGVELVGYLYRPTHATGKVPCVVMGHGFSGTQDRLAASAERFAGAGFAALTFDYRNFGESGGQPRQLISIRGQLEDWRGDPLRSRPRRCGHRENRPVGLLARRRACGLRRR